MVDEPLSPSAREDKQFLGQVFVDFIEVRLRRELPTLSRSEAAHHGQVALMIFRGILDELAIASPHARPRLQQAMRNAILRYLSPVLTESKSGRAVGSALMTTFPLPISSRSPQVASNGRSTYV